MQADSFAVRLYRIAMGAPVCASDPEWVQVWALSVHGQGEAGADVRDRARTLKRYRTRPLPRHSLTSCLKAIRNATHPQARMIWLQVFTATHPGQAGPELCRLMSTPLPSPSLYKEVSSACAWALARLGRDVLSLLEERFANAPFGVRDLFCQALWFMGEQARGCERWLARHDSGWSRAVLHRLQSRGWRQLLAWRATPLWLDSQSVAALAQLAYSLDPEERLYAVRALGGWGPGQEQAARVLQALASVPELAGEVLAQLRQLRVFPEPAALLALLQNPVTCEAARALLLTRAPLLHLLEDSQWYACALAQLSGVEPSVYQTRLVRVLPRWPLNAVKEGLALLAARGLHSPRDAARLQLWLEHEEAEIRTLAISAWSQLGGGVRKLVRALNDPAPGVRLAAQKAVLSQFEYLRQALHHSDVLERVLHEEVLDRYLDCPEQLSQLLTRLGRRPNDPRAQQLRSTYSLERDWANWWRWPEQQRRRAGKLAACYRQVPEALVQSMLRGRNIDPCTLSLVERYHPQAPAVLKTLFLLVDENRRSSVGTRLRALGQRGWSALLELLPDAEAGPAAAEQLCRLTNEQESGRWLASQGLRLLRCPSPNGRKALVDALVASGVPLWNELPWALALCLENSTAARLLAEFYSDDPPAAIETACTALLHEEPAVRAGAVKILRLWKPPGLEVRIRGLPREPDARVRLQRLFLLNDYGPLTGAELAQLDELGRYPEFAQEIALQYRTWT